MKYIFTAVFGIVTGALLVLGWHNMSATEVRSGVISTEIPPDAVEIVMSGTGYVPSNITISSGTRVAFVTTETGDAWPASNIHPTHGIYPEFDPSGKKCDCDPAEGMPAGGLSEPRLEKPLVLPEGLEQTLKLNKAGSYFGDALRPVEAPTTNSLGFQVGLIDDTFLHSDNFVRLLHILGNGTA